MSTGLEARAPFSTVLRHREFRALLIAHTLSVGGDDLARIALAIVFFQRTHSPFIAALAFSLPYLPSLLAGPLLSTLGDRYARRRVMVVCDIARMVLVGGAAVALAFGWPSVVPLGLVLLAAFFSPAFDASRAALVPRVLTGEQYLAGSVLTGIVHQFTQIAAYVLGAAAVGAVGGDGVLLFDATTFGMSAVLLLMFVRQGQPQPSDPDGPRVSMVSMMVTGARDVFRRPALRALLVVSAVMMAAAAVPEGLAVVYAAKLGVSGAGQGLLVASVPIGCGLGGVLLTRFVSTQARERAIRPLAVGCCVLLILTVIGGGFVFVFVLWTLMGLLFSFEFAANASFVLHTPDYVRARAMGLAQGVLTFATALGTLAGGAIAVLIDVRYVVAGAGLVALAAIAVPILRWPASLGGRDKEPLASVEVVGARAG